MRNHDLESEKEVIDDRGDTFELKKHASWVCPQSLRFEHVLVTFLGYVLGTQKIAFFSRIFFSLFSLGNARNVVRIKRSTLADVVTLGCCNDGQM